MTTPSPNGDTSDPTAAEALRYVALGWQVLPVWSLRNGVCSCTNGPKCRTPGKHPRTHHGAAGASAEPARVKLWRWQSANLGIATGPTSRLLVVDVDPRNGGTETLQRLQAELGVLPPGPMVKTGGGGWHLYFAWPEGGIAGRSVDGIEIKADGAYVVAPPSMHHSGGRYAWEIPPNGEPLPSLPDAWLRWLGGDVLHRPQPPCYTDHSPIPVTQTTAPKNVTQTAQDSADNTDNTDNTDNARTSISGSQQKSCEPPTLGTFIDECIKRTLPAHPGQRHASVFKLARLLRGNPEVVRWPPKKLQGVVNRWYGLAVEKVGAGTIRADPDENWTDFAEGWGKVRCAGETGIMTTVLERAKAAELPKVALEYETDRVRLLIKLCRELQREAGDKPFFLAASTVQGLVGFHDRMAASRMLRGLCLDGVLKLVERGTAKGRQASSYRYVGD